MIHGECDPAFAAVREAFEAGFGRGEEVGAAVAVYAGDTLVVDLHGGLADRRAERPWTPGTACLAFSCAKAVTATAALLLAERGLVDLDRPVTDWWPEFRAPGAVGAHLLTHEVGLPALARTVTPGEAHDAAAMAALLAAQEPEWPPGTAHGYHALTFGWLAGEIVRRLSGTSVGAFVAREIAGPRGLDLYLGAPDEVIARTARLTVAPHRRGIRAATGTTEPRAFDNPRVTSLPGGNNNPEMLRAGWPALGLVTTARGLAGFYRDLLAGRLLGADTLATAVRRRVSGPDRVLGVDSSFGLGFMRPSPPFQVPSAAQESAFGHTGLSGAVGLGDLDRGIAVGYVTNGVSDELSGGDRTFRLLEAAYSV